MDFISDQLFDGKHFWVLTLINLYTMESLLMNAEKAINCEDFYTIVQHVS